MWGVRMRLASLCEVIKELEATGQAPGIHAVAGQTGTFYLEDELSEISTTKNPAQHPLGGIFCFKALWLSSLWSYFAL
jgi:hypothetical protein